MRKVLTISMPRPMEAHRRRRLRVGLALNAAVAVALLVDGAVQRRVFVVSLGVAEALFTGLVLWTYVRASPRGGSLGGQNFRS
jgi:hypothetical protein